MKLYKFKVTFENQSDFLREIVIKPSQTFEDFHNIIKECSDLKNNELASFYFCDEEFNKVNEITLIDMSEKSSQKLIMKDCIIKDFVNKKNKYFIYEYDFLNLKSFKIEFISIEDSEKGQNYPQCIKSKKKLIFVNKNNDSNFLDIDKNALLKDFDNLLKDNFQTD